MRLPIRFCFIWVRRGTSKAMKNKEHRLFTAIYACVKAGKAVMEVYGTDFTVVEKKDMSPLTMADKKAHEIIEDYLLPYKIPILSEEGKEIPYAERCKWDQLWIVDPLDGTKEFVKRNGEFTINIALVQGNRPVLGVIYVPVKEVLYFALDGKGAFRLENANQIKWENRVESKEDAPGNLKRIIDKSMGLPVEKKPMRPFTIIGSRSHPSKALSEYIEEKKNIHGNIDYTPAGSSLKICRVAEGSADVYPRLGPTMEWDTADGHDIAECLGVKMFTY